MDWRRRSGGGCGCGRGGGGGAKAFSMSRSARSATTPLACSMTMRAFSAWLSCSLRSWASRTPDVGGWRWWPRRPGPGPRRRRCRSSPPVDAVEVEGADGCLRRRMGRRGLNGTRPRPPWPNRATDRRSSRSRFTIARRPGSSRRTGPRRSAARTARAAGPFRSTRPRSVGRRRRDQHQAGGGHVEDVDAPVGERVSNPTSKSATRLSASATSVRARQRFSRDVEPPVTDAAVWTFHGQEPRAL